MIILRLKRGGRKKSPYYKVVAAEKDMKRDGRNVEELGFYHPCANPAAFQLKEDRVAYYLTNGATMSDTVKSLVKKAGIKLPS
ncbi:MAG: 30S ribosomal protein S16 [Candidatus Cloacimonadota bacterium]|nr:MAG: 30S ribosomal protein S16 [Candidatus Cloacimonadota bacterium]